LEFGQVPYETRDPPFFCLTRSGFFAIANVRQREASGIDFFVSDTNSPRELTERARGGFHGRTREPAGRAVDGRRKAIVEPVFGARKQQRGKQQFPRRGLARVRWSSA
jgi:hypothetical protein